MARWLLGAQYFRPLQESVMASTKVQLNDEQWSALQALREANARRCPTDSIKVSNRLRSNGFVAIDRQGDKLLTDQGLHRLQQGR